ncbi:MAG: hypothetical protein ACYS0K_18250 [Planctomycetota bacterium]|jgi:hypothetical protein
MFIAVVACAVFAQAQGHATELEPVAFLVGKLTGKGSHPMGSYDETLTGEWSLNGTVIVVRSRSVMQGRTSSSVYEDLRVFGNDPARKVIRMRQYGMGDVAVYDVAIEDDGQRIVLNEVAHEGNARGEWRYTYRRKSATECEYEVDTRQGDTWQKYVTGSVGSKHVFVARKEGAE